MKGIGRNRICFYTSMFEGRSSVWEIAEFAVKKGVGALELMNFCDELRTPDITEARKIGKFARAHNLALPCFSIGVNFYEDQSRAKNIEIAKSYADVCAELEVPYLHHTAILNLDKASLKKPMDELMDIAADVSLQINDYAAKRGVKTIIEDQGLVVNGIKGYKQFRERTNGRIGALLDVANIMFVDEVAEDFCREFISSIRHVHLKDYLLTDTALKPEGYITCGGKFLTDCEIGTGVVNFKEILSELEDGGYDGYYSLEFMGVKSETEVDRVLERMKSGFHEKQA